MVWQWAAFCKPHCLTVPEALGGWLSYLQRDASFPPEKSDLPKSWTMGSSQPPWSSWWLGTELSSKQLIMQVVSQPTNNYFLSLPTGFCTTLLFQNKCSFISVHNSIPIHVFFVKSLFPWTCKTQCSNSLPAPDGTLSLSPSLFPFLLWLPIIGFRYCFLAPCTLHWFLYSHGFNGHLCHVNIYLHRRCVGRNTSSSKQHNLTQLAQIRRTVIIT